MKISEKTLAQLRAKGEKRLLTTEEARSIAGISVQPWQRLVRMKGFPERTHLGRTWCMNAGALADFLETMNAIEAGMTLTEVAEFARTTTYTLRDLADAGKFIAPLGLSHGHPRYARDDVEAWHSKRLGGLQPPAALDAKRKKKAARNTHGARHGETKTNSRSGAQD